MEDLKVKTILDLVDGYLETANVVIHKYDDKHILARRIDNDVVIFHYVDDNGNISTTESYASIGADHQWFDNAIEETGLIIVAQSNFNDKLLNPVLAGSNDQSVSRIYRSIIDRQADTIKRLKNEISELRTHLI